jgi:acyl dehydratase
MRAQAPEVTPALLSAFAAASGDANPMHLDPEVARAAGHDDVIAHGMLTMAWLGRLLTEHSPQARLQSFRVRFTAPTPLGAAPTLSARVVDPAPRGPVRLLLTAELADGTVTAVGEATICP